MRPHTYNIILERYNYKEVDKKETLARCFQIFSFLLVVITQ